MVADRAMFRERPFPGLLFFIWTYPFTPAGKIVVLALAVSAIAGSITDDMPIYQLPVTILVMVMLASMIGSVLRWFSVTIDGDWPARVTAGQTFRVDFTVTNPSRLPLYDVSLDCFQLPSTWLSRDEDRIVEVLMPGESATLSLQVTPRRRGLFPLPSVRVFSTFPFNLFRNQLGRKESRPVLVVPQFKPLTRLNLEMGHRYQPGGIAFTSLNGESPEYIGNREYLPGDSPRHIDFKSWARLAVPVVREFQEEYFFRVGLVLDTFVPPSFWDFRRREQLLEAAVSLTAAISDVFSRGEYLLDVFAAGPDLHIFRTGRHTTSIDAVLEILAGVPACRVNPFPRMTAALGVEFPQVSAVVCIFLGWDEWRRQLVQAALESGCRVKVVIIQRASNNPLPDSLPEAEVLRLTPEQIECGLSEL